MWVDRLLQGLLDTLLMVGVSSLIALLVGVPMAVLLVTSRRVNGISATIRIRNGIERNRLTKAPSTRLSAGAS